MAAGVATIIRRSSPEGDRFLMGKRSLAKKLGAGWWSPIAGGIESGESEPQAIVRECLEEIGVTARPIRKIAELPIENDWTLHFWLTEIDGEPSLANDENTELRWFTIDELRSTPYVFQKDIDVFMSVLSDT